MQYPKYEILFCVERYSDEAYPLVLQLLEKYPNVDARVFVGGPVVGINPKINNMNPGYEVAKYKLLLISDAAVFMGNQTLLSMVECLKEDVGMVHQMPNNKYHPEFGSTLEQLYFSTFFAKGYLFTNFLGWNASCGMSCLFRKEIMDKKGGIKEFGQSLAEDYHLAGASLEMGYKNQMCPVVGMLNRGASTTQQVHDRMIRWMKLRMSVKPILYLVEPLAACFPQGVLVACAFNIFLGWSPYAYFTLHILVWMGLDYLLIHIVQGGPIELSKGKFARVWFHREFHYILLFLKSLRNPNIKWRSKEYRLQWKGVAVAEPVYHSNGIHQEKNNKNHINSNKNQINNNKIQINNNNYYKSISCFHNPSTTERKRNP